MPGPTCCSADRATTRSAAASETTFWPGAPARTCSSSPRQDPSNSDSIVDFSFVDGDTIDLSALLDAAFSTGQPISGFVRALQSGSSIVVQVDTNGGANSFADVATLTGYGTNSADLVRVTFEGLNHVVLT